MASRIQNAVQPDVTTGVEAATRLSDRPGAVTDEI